MNNICNIILVQLWNLETSSWSFYDLQKMQISWRQFLFSSWWLTTLITAVHIFKTTKYLKLIIIGCWVIVNACKLKKVLELGPDLQNQTKKELGMFVVSCSNISPSFILILIRIQEKQLKIIF